MEEQLRQSHRLDAVGQLTGGVAHDFNNMLTVILGNAELLQEGLERDVAHRELAEMIVGAANSAAELTKRLLAFARKQALNPIAVDSNQLITDMYPLLRRTLAANLEFEMVAESDVWQALVDPAQLENAVLNLCINARDAMLGGGRLRIETKNVELDEDYAAGHVDVKSGQYVSITVTDTGCGIAPDVLRRVFEPFFTTKDKGKGTGLGLAMVYGFIKQSDGHISIFSEPGQGTTVRMYLPRAVGDSPHAAVATGAFRIIHGTETILLVEDDEQVRRFALSQLKSLGYNVLQAQNGVEAMELIERNERIDLLFTDVVMPGMSGRQLADSARRRRPGLRVLFTSGYNEDAIVHHGRLDHGVQLLPKPYRRRELAKRIRSIFDAPC
jgi:CheY-like chemotaxis protein